MKYSEIYLTVANKLFDQSELHIKANDGDRPCVCPYLWSFASYEHEGFGQRNVYNILQAFQTAFKPEYVSDSDRWFDNYEFYKNNQKYQTEVRDHRVYSLLLMHEMAKDYEELLEIYND